MPEQKKAVVPRLRFPEFRNAGPWEVKRLGDVCEVNPASPDLPDDFIYIDLESVESGRLLRKNRVKRDNAPIRAQRLLKQGDILYQTVRPYQRNNLLFTIDDGEEYVASTGYAQLRAYESGRFLFQLLHTDAFVYQVLARCTGTNYPAINSSDLEIISVPFPSLCEQQKIADCLSSLDELIELQAKKLEALQAHKKGLMQQLFPREGETTPRLRFPEFRDAGPWEVKRLGDVVSITGGGTPSRSRKDFWNGNIPWVSSSDVSDESIHELKITRWITSEAVSSSATKIVPENSILLVSRVGVGKVAISRIPVCTSQDFTNLTPLRDDFIFLGYYLSAWANVLKSFGQGMAIQGFKKQDIENLAIPLPDANSGPLPDANSGEQQKIADCLSSLDELIELQAKQLEALKAHKKGLMQQLFPQEIDL